MDGLSHWIAFQIAGDQGLPIVFLHGVGGDAESWRLQLDGFKADHRAVAWDMPGYGDSAPLEEMTVNALVDTVSILFDRLSIERAHLVGHAFGGMVALAFAAAHPLRLRSLTLTATSAGFDHRKTHDPDGDLSAKAWREQFVEQQVGPLDRGASMAELAPKLIRGLIGDDADPKGLEQAILSLAAVPEQGYRAAIDCLAAFDHQDELANIQTPSLLIAGEKDPIVPPVVMQAMADAMPAARLETLPACGHLPHLERPDAFNGLLADFLRSLNTH